MKLLHTLLVVAALTLFASTGAQPRPVKTGPDIHVWVASDVAPSAKINLTINTRNVPVTLVAAYAVNAESWLRGSPEIPRPLPKPNGMPAARWKVKLDSAGGRAPDPARDTYYSRSSRLPHLNPGVYEIVVTPAGATGHAPSAAAMINVTNLTVVVKRSPSKLLLWVTAAGNGRPISAARVNLYDRDGTIQSSAKTGADGSVLIARRPGWSTIVVSRGRDFAGLASTAINPDGRLRAHFETDRPIYRPGQTLFFKTILRRTLGQRYRVDAGAACSITLRDPKDNPVDELTLTSNEMGSIHGQFKLPAEGATGPYSLVLSTRDENAYQTVTVAEYRKPQFQVDVVSTQRRFLAGETGGFRVTANYFFGAPVQQASIRYTIRWSPSPFMFGAPRPMWRRSGNGNLYPRDTYAYGGFVAENTVFTDEHGQAVIPFPTASQVDAVYSIDVTVEDSARQQVAGSGAVPVYAAAIRLGLQTDAGYGLLGDAVPVELEARDLDNHPVAARIDLVLAKPDWNPNTGKPVERTLSKWTVQLPRTGHLSIRVNAVEEGALILRASAADGTGRTAKGSMSLFVAGPYATVYRPTAQPQVTIRLNRDAYAPGDIVKAYITTNRPKSPLMITVEGGDVWRHTILTRPKIGQSFEFRATAAMSPNAFISASQWVNNRYVGNEADIPVPNAADTLHVALKPNKPDYRPGDTASFSVLTTNQDGAPVAAEVALAVVDEAIYALSPDTTADLYGFYWGQRSNQVTTTMSAPVEMAGGAYQRVSTVAPLRERFEDTAFWTADLTTAADGTGAVAFEMPGNLTTWRATARGVTASTSVGGATSMVKANRPTMLRLAVPRQIVQGDRLTLVGTLDNRTSASHDYDVSLNAQGIDLLGPALIHIRVGGGQQATVEWKAFANTMPAEAQCVLVGQAVATDVPAAEKPPYSDAVEAKFPVAPRGVREVLVKSGTLTPEGGTNVTLTLPTDRIEPASVVTMRVWHGLDAVRKASAASIMNAGSWSPASAANQLEVAAETGMKRSDEVVREALALISRTQRGDGWGWWEEAPPDADITARVLSALSAAHRTGLDTYANLISAARLAAVQRYNQINLWEDRARLAAALQDSEPDSVEVRIAEVLRRGVHLSPYAKLRLAESMAKSNAVGAKALTEAGVENASIGPDSAFVPTGAGIGWTASDTETTAQALSALLVTGGRPELVQKLARWLVRPASNGWPSADDHGAIVHALSLYLALHPESPTLGTVDLTVNGVAVQTTHGKFDDAVSARIPRELLQNGPNTILVNRSGGGEAFFTLEASVYRPLSGESAKGVRVLRRFEVQNEAGIWVELSRIVLPGEPVRCTVVAWGDDVPDAVRIVEPIPAGFELVDDETNGGGHMEVRDAAVVHYLVNSGNPVTFRYFIRAESEGKLTALPATAETIRRPANHGQSAWQTLDVRVRP